MNDKEKLKPCPFCGKSVMEVSRESLLTGDDYFTVICNINKGGCGGASGYRRTPEKAVKSWNRRFEKEVTDER